jgi:hypothetical protein
MPEDNDDSGVLSNIVKLLPVYAVYVFIAGWTYSDFYFRSFGVNPRWLDIDFHDVLTRGFTILFGGGGTERLWFVYLLMATVPIIVEALREVKGHPTVRRVLEFVVVAVLGGLLPLTYCISRRAGINQANLDKSDHSMLPTINFTVNKHPSIGQLLFMKNGTYYIHDVQAEGKSEVKQVSIFRAEEVSQVTLVEFR